LGRTIIAPPHDENSNSTSSAEKLIYPWLHSTSCQIGNGNGPIRRRFPREQEPKSLHSEAVKICKPLLHKRLC
jgi:hypothetical protein